MKIKLYALSLALFFITNNYAQIIINEYSASNYNDFTDGFFEFEDWVELYNAGSNSVNLSGYYLSDNIDNPTKWEFPNDIIIGAGQHLVIFCSDRDMVFGNDIHAGFKLTQTKQEWVVLSAPDLTLLDAIQMTNTSQMNHSRGRITDGNATWGLFSNPTPGFPNTNAFQEYAQKPVLSLTAGFYANSTTISIDPISNAEIRYTLDGSEPTPSSTLYTTPININNTAVLKAKTYSLSSDILPSFTEANTYFIGENHTIPVLSIAGSDLANLLAGDQFEPIGSFEFFDADGAFIDEAYGDYNKHGNDSWAYSQRGIDYITRDQMGYTSSIAHQIFPNKERDRFQRLIIKAGANDNYPFEGGAHIRDAYVHTLSQLAELELDERTWEPCILYLNGQYWGVYDIREKVDDPDYTRKYYDQGTRWLDFIKTWGFTWEEYGSRNDWDALVNFITSNSMADQTNYEQVKEELNVQSLVDYMIINTHVVCMDWLNWNTAWWRGRNPEGEAQKWRYAMWDLDATFGHYINYTGIPNETPQSDPCDNETYDQFGDPEGHVQLVTSMLENDEFHSLYVNRYADLNNSYLSCDSMLAVLDRMIARIEPEMPRQVQRWGGTMGGWQSAVDELRNFILARCDWIDGGIVDCYDVEGPYPVTVKIEPVDAPNGVRVNTFIPDVYPFSGDYFSGTGLSFEAVPDIAWEFDHWEVDTNSFNPDQFANKIDLQLANNGEVVTAVFRPAIPCANPSDLNLAPTLSTIEIDWSGLFNSLSFEVNWRPLGSTDDWEVISTVEENYTIFGLEVCTAYEVRVRSICENALGNYQDFIIETECINSTDDLSAGIAEWTVYPTPFQTETTVDFILMEAKDMHLTVFSIDGKRVFDQNIGKKQPGQHRVILDNVQNWNKGMYLIQMQTEDGIIIKRVIKE